MVLLTTELQVTNYKALPLFISALDSFEIFCPGHQNVFPIEHVITAG